MKKSTMKLNPGDVIAIPRAQGGYYFVIHLMLNRFGDAYGLFDGYSKSADVTSTWNPTPAAEHVYSGNRLVKTGRWLKVDHREDLLSLFSYNPEIYHSKTDNMTDTAIGPHGSAENAEGELRALSELEATRIGLNKGTYRQIMMEEQLEKHLQNVVG